jgi:glyoxylase-like metal-dependent hydrolase (beta-lactamase superfamily II)
MRVMVSAAPEGTRLYVQHHGNMHMDARRMAGVPGYFQRASDRVPQDLWRPCPCLTFLIRHPTGNILFDLGCTEDWQSAWQATGIAEMVPYDEWTAEQQLEPVLARTGLGVGDIDLVVASHLHMDHCGKLDLFQRTRADIVIQKAEYEGAMNIAPPGIGGYVTSQYRDLDVRWRMIEGDLDLASGIRVLSLPGHSFGSQGLAIRLQVSGLFVLASDAAQVLPNLNNPPIASPNVYDSIRWRESIRRLQQMREQDGARIICGHEPSQLDELKLSPDFYT